jgi:hypothetical protein
MSATAHDAAPDIRAIAEVLCREQGAVVPDMRIRSESLELCARTMQRTNSAGVGIDDKWELHFRDCVGGLWFTPSKTFGQQ